MADPSPKILVIVDREQTYGDFWRVCLTAEAQEREMKEINAAAEEARLLAEAIEAERLRVEEEARKAATAVYDDSPIVAKAYASETREATFDDVAALDVVPERPLMQFQLSRPVWKSKFYGAFVLNRRVNLHAIDAMPARWRGDAGSSPLERARTAASSPRNDLSADALVDFNTGRDRPTRSASLASLRT